MSSDELWAVIEDAWSSSHYPGDDRIAYDTSLEGIQIARFFRGREWKSVTLRSLRSYRGDASACLSFMLPEGFRCYLPSYMIIAVDEYEEADVVADSAVNALTPPANFAHALWQERVSSFSQAQRKAIVAFLRFMDGQHGVDYPVHGPRDALPYWSNAV